MSELRLTSNVVPIVYDLQIWPNLETFVFQGHVTITVHVKVPVKQVILHASNLAVTHASINKCVVGWELAARELLVLTPKIKLPVGTHMITISYQGYHTDDLIGFFRTKTGAKNKDGSVQYALVTQFESTAARRALPCFDEPKMKAIFYVEMTVASGLTALSNMNEVTQDRKNNGDGTTTHTFAPTPIMSSYLLAFCVGDYRCISTKSSKGIPVTVYAYWYQMGHCRFALDIAVKALAFYEELFGIDYPLPKLDYVSTIDHNAGAMENWGLITHRSTVILYSETESTFHTKLAVALTVCHETAHMWFGNLVTMEWWSDLWLNEGFAKYMEYLCIDSIHPEWNIFDKFTNERLATVMSTDAKKSSHPIMVPIKEAHETETAFDNITYSKGAAVIRMIKSHIGDESFKRGLNNYLKRFAYRNTITADLWDHWTESSNVDVGAMMHAWTKKAGYPVIKIEILSWHDEKLVIQLSQKKFGSGSSDSKQLWHVPITYFSSTSSNLPESIMLTTKSQTITLHGIDESNGWVHFNPNHTTYCIFEYPDRLRDLLKKNRWNGLTSTERQMMIHSEYLLAQHKKSSKSTKAIDYLKMVSMLKGSTDYWLWKTALMGIGGVERIVCNVHLSYPNTVDLTPKFNRLISEYIRPTMLKLGWQPVEGESDYDEMLRALLARQLGKYGDKAAIEYANKQFGLMFKAVQSGKDSPVSSNMRMMVLSTYAQNAASIENLLILFKKTVLVEVQEDICRALGNVRMSTDENKCLARKVLAFALEPARRPKETLLLLITLANTFAKELIWETYQEKFEELKTRFGESAYLRHMTQPIIAGLHDANRVEQFFKQNPFPGAKKEISQALESIRIRARWIQRDGHAIIEHFKDTESGM